MLMLLVACAEERATAPSLPEPLRAMNLDDKLVLEVSEWVAADSTDSKDSFRVSFENIPMIQEGRADDIQIRFLARDCASTFDLELFLPNLHEWRPVEHHRRPADVVCAGMGPFIWEHARTSKGFGYPDLPSVLGSESDITLRGDDIFGLSARAIEYDPQYDFVPIGTASPFHASALAFDGINLWVSEWYADTDGQPTDSVFILDISGQRLRAFDISPHRILAMCSDESGSIWAYILSTPRRIARLDENAILRESFTIEGRVRSEITWWDDRIWFLSGDSGVTSILGINVSASIDAGEAEINQRFRVRLGAQHFTGLFIMDNTLYGIADLDRKLWRFSFLGEVLEKWPMTLAGIAESGARDGTSMWLLHRNYGEQWVGIPGATRLSRVRLPLSNPETR